MNTSVGDDGLKWFGEGFDGFPRRLPEDCVEYVVYIINDSLQSAATTRTRLNELSRTSNELKKKLLEDYIWQRDAFELELQPSLSSLKPNATNTFGDKSPPKIPHLRGRTNFGDSVADEWLIVYLLLELSKHFPDAWIRVYDTDGEFLLIEAANALPKWLNPDIAENRVWINHGHLRIIPLDDQAAPRSISLQDALTFVRKHPDRLIISPFVEDEAFYRLRDYPSAISSSLHHAVIHIPRNLAYVLHRNPTYISSAIEAFYLRDPVSLKPLATKDISTLRFPPEDFVATSVKFTKVGYAQLHSQVFDPPPAWMAVVPRMQDPRAQMGMKLACGFEMLLADPQTQDRRVVREIKLLLDDLETGDDTLPSDGEIASWPQTQDDERWLDIDFNDFERELAGRKAKEDDEGGKGFGDARAQESLRKMVSRFEDFLTNDSAGLHGVDDFVEDGEDSESDSMEDRGSDLNEDDFRNAMRDVQKMDSDDIAKNGLLDEARRLALEDAENSSNVNEDEEVKKVMELMEQELKSHGALNLTEAAARTTKPANDRPFYGPERPPAMRNEAATKSTTSYESNHEDISRDDEDLSSDDEEFNDINLALARNMLESFKGQAGQAGPAGNLMRAMGVTMPRDEGGNDDLSVLPTSP